MKASTMFFITVALMLGLGAVAVAKYAGFFDSQQKVQQPEPPKPRILAASQNLFADIALSNRQVVVREVTDYELEEYKKNPRAYLPAMPSAAVFRVARTNIPAGTALQFDHFHDLEWAESITKNLNPHYRAVNVAVDKSESNGGLIRKGEYVDVFLTCKICDGVHCDQAITQTTCIAKNCKVIVKRNSLFTMLKSNPDNVPVDYTLQANPYRAALISYSKNIGRITLIPNPNPKVIPNGGLSGGRPSFSDPTNEEYRQEDERVDEVLSGKNVVSSADLERLFRLVPIPTPAPPIRVEQFGGTRMMGIREFSQSGVATAPSKPKPDFRPRTEIPTKGYVFHHPEANLGGTSGSP